MGKRRRKPRGMPVIMRGGRPMMFNPQRARPPKDMTEKQIRQKIHELEYRRMEIGKNNKRPNIRAVHAIDHVTTQIQTLYKELELRKKKDGNKSK